MNQLVRLSTCAVIDEIAIGTVSVIVVHGIELSRFLRQRHSENLVDCIVKAQAIVFEDALPAEIVVSQYANKRQIPVDFAQIQDDAVV